MFQNTATIAQKLQPKIRYFLAFGLHWGKNGRCGPV